MKNILDIWQAIGCLVSLGVFMFVLELFIAPLVIIPKIKEAFGFSEKKNRIEFLEKKVSELEEKINSLQ